MPKPDTNTHTPGQSHTEPDLPAVKWPTVSEVSDQLFTLFDTNHDKAIAFSEISAVLDPRGKSGELPNLLQRLLEPVDTNGDHSLSQAEITTAYGKLDSNGDGVLSPADLPGALRGQPGTVPMLALVLNGLPVPGNPDEPKPKDPPTVAEVVDELFARFDANKDKSLSLAELTAVLDPQAKHAKLDAALARVVALVDTNGDKQMSQAELTAAVGTLDTNHDGVLDHHDHLPGPEDDGEGGSIDLVGQLMPKLHDFIDASGH